MAGQIVRDVAPHTRDFLFVYKHGMKGAASCPSFGSGLKFIEAGDLERGCSRWRDCELNGIEDPHLSYNLALCDGMEGDVAAALERVQDAIDQLGEPDKDMMAAEQTYKAVLESAGMLNEQIVGVTLATGRGHPSRGLGANPQVKQAQHMLSVLGFDAGPADGLMGRRTRTAIVSFQRSRELPETGRVDRGLLKTLRLTTRTR